MKKFIIIMSAVCLTLASLCACGTKTNDKNKKAGPSNSSLMSDASSALSSVESRMESVKESASDKVSEYHEYMDESVISPGSDVLS